MADPAGRPLFDLVAGLDCLDFTNTLEDRAYPRPRERLETYGDLLAFSEQAGIVDDQTAGRLALAAGQRAAEAQETLRRAIRLREAIFGICSKLARGDTPAPSNLEVLNAHLGRALRHLQLEPEGPGARWAWGGGDALERPLWPLARSAAELLTSDERSRVRECRSGTCRWLFIDRSRNRSRRWCDMATCGNRHKARRFYRRRQGSESGR